MAAMHELQLADGWRLLIQATFVAMILLGAVLLMTPALGEKLFYFVYYQSIDPPADFTDEARRYIRFTNAVLGAVIIGWMVLSLQLVALRRSNSILSIRTALMSSFGWWFVLDTGFSALNGIWGNVALNVLAACGILLPLLLGN